MKRVYLAQIPYYFDTNVKYVFLQYSTGMIWSYALTHPGTKGMDFSTFALKTRHEKNPTVIKPIDQPFVGEEQNKNLLAVG